MAPDFNTLQGGRFDERSIQHLRRPCAACAPAGGGGGSGARPAVDHIARLDVSDSWKRRFRLIEKAGGAELRQSGDLKSAERRGIGFNFLAFLFGPFYFLAKGLWRPAVAYSLLAVAVGMTLDMLSKGKLSHGLGYGFAFVYSMRANVLYYRKVVLAEMSWF
ncbi:DUF2628 domain-containing protein [Rhodanobacter sp. AS-Z3]|uniref:DUF2628 domain-containing protein n=1 Tax=Rhodanobacter sp. AS-Z3 TaxID=3031330 RepID=UPI002478504E|nr:DUF2628 domain-containing protein [Rhodanobacter sp. AS-Z3]WEN14775.1 DUF2628 domain-containing protein [Rhodanobacter sp. AS-Z3]